MDLPCKHLNAEKAQMWWLKIFPITEIQSPNVPAQLHIQGLVWLISAQPV